METVGIVYIVYGNRARLEFEQSKRTLQNDWPVFVIDETVCRDIGKPGRNAKTQLYELSPFEYTLFLDADTRVHGDLSIGFNMLRDGWELIMVPSYDTSFPKILKLDEWETMKDRQWPRMLNTGVMWFKKTIRISGLFKTWHREWLQFKDRDQGAFMRALVNNPVQLFLLSKAYNSGEVVEHLFGRAQ